MWLSGEYCCFSLAGAAGSDLVWLGMRVVFVDRDDTVVENSSVTGGTATPGDLFVPGLVRLVPGAGEALRRIVAAGYVIVVVTNQGGLAAGRCTMREVEATNDAMRVLLSAAGVEVAGVYVAGARPGGAVARWQRDPEGWRKPGGGMVRAAATELGIDVASSWMVGDAERDVEAGVAGGVLRDRCLRLGVEWDWGRVAGLIEKG